MTLMDKLEKIKADNATNDAIFDDTAGQAYVEHFGLETFFRADRAVKANKVTKCGRKIHTEGCANEK
jgi:vacuolar protein sorting-associated protein VTA1